MANPVTYICINMHGSCLPTDSKNSNQSPVMMQIISEESVFSMEKYTVAFPAYNGMKKMNECRNALYEIIKNPNITKRDMECKLNKFLGDTNQYREKAEKKRTDNEYGKNASTCKVTGWNHLEPINGFFYYKTYEIDYADANSGSIDVLDSKWHEPGFKDKRINILSYDFLINYSPFPKVIQSLINLENVHTYSNGEHVIKSIDLVQLTYLLKHIGMSNVFIIDVSCAVNAYADSERANTAMKYNASKDIINKFPSGKILTVTFPNEGSTKGSREEEEGCVKCSNREACAVGSVAGVACCLGSCALGFSPVASSVMGATTATAAAAAATTIVRSEKMKRGGGKKTRKKRRLRKTKKKRYKNRRSKTRVT